MSKFIDKIKHKLNADDRFYFHGKGTIEGLWATRKIGEDGCGNFINLKKTVANKGYGAFEIYSIPRR